MDPNTQAAVLAGFMGIVGALLGTGLGYWLEGLREKRRLDIEEERERKRREFEMAMESQRIQVQAGLERDASRREHYRIALEYHKTRASLRGFDLERQDLAEVDLSGADLQGANLSGAKLSFADLSGSNLVLANLENATLVNADLSRARLMMANFEGANLASAKLHEALLWGAGLEGAELTAAQLSSANLRDAILEGADLRSATLEGADLRNASLRGANLTHANLVGADLSTANLDGASLAQAWFDHTTRMPSTWENVVASKPDDDEATEVTMDNMNQSTTVTGKRFYYTGSLSSGLVVYPTGKDGVGRSGGQVPVSARGITFIRDEIRRAGEIAMGACRDNPSTGSLGYKLLSWGRSPQWLSYVIPLLAEEGFCEFYREGTRYMVRHRSA